MKILATGTKVVPFKKTAQGRTPGLESFNVWKKAQETGQPFLYVALPPIAGCYAEYLLCDRYGVIDGDYFARSDFTLYKEEGNK